MSRNADVYVLSLDAVGVADAPRVGAKAAALGALLQAGFPVPPGLCVTAAAFRLALAPTADAIQSALHAHDLWDPAAVEVAADRIAALLADLRVPTPVRQALDGTLGAGAEPGAGWAVRSSATAEDRAAASFAGQYRSVIGVRGGDALDDAIVSVWRSFFSANALAARAAQNALGGDEAMAVLILPVVDAECAGVALSVDPVQRRGDRVVVTAAWGLGPGVVDGSVQADTAWVRRQGSTEGFEVEEQRVVEQVALAPEGGIMRAPVPAQRRRAACLPQAWLERVAQFCVAAEVWFGYPQDMEWAIAGGQVWVLQSRPLTALPRDLVASTPFPVAWQDEQERRQAWVHYPYWRHVLTPLEMDYAVGREAAQGESALYAGSPRTWRAKIVNGRAYTTWAPTALSAGDRRIRRAAMQDLAARLHREGRTTWEHWGPEIIRATQRLDAFDAAGADGPGLAQHLEDARAACRRHMMLHGLVWRDDRRPLHDAYAAVSGLVGPAVEEAVERLLEGVATTTTQLIDSLYALACAAREAPAVAALVADPPADVLDRLAALPEAKGFLAQFRRFLDRFGDRTGLGYGSDATIAEPAWREDPALVLRFVAPYLVPDLRSPAAARAHGEAEREADLKRLCGAGVDPEAVDRLRRELAHARRQATVAEEHNHYIDQLSNGQLRRAILHAADWLVERGVLRSRDEVLWLHYDEILAALRTEAPPLFAEAIAARQAQHAAWERLEPPPLLGIPEPTLPERPPLQDDVRAVEAGREGQIVGLGASPGRHRGRARIVPTSVRLPDLAPGEVLVAENAGPRWTPLLPVLGGLVLDGGALGQHHAITAREYAVPAVIGTGNATRRIPDGAWVTLDGTAGTVDLDPAATSDPEPSPRSDEPGDA
jgi:phosphohistidine swiveling domain-containing protein